MVFPYFVYIQYNYKVVTKKCLIAEILLHNLEYAYFINMTIQKVLNGEQVTCLQVNVLRELSPTQYIVGDRTGMAIMTTDETSSKFVEVGKGLRMVKPAKVDEKVIKTHPKISPMKTKAMELDIDYDKMDDLVGQEVKVAPEKTGINFLNIENDFGDNAVINQVLAYVTSSSRIIDGKFGPYQICNLVDFDGNTVAINLYKSNINKLEINKIYKLEKIKKTGIKSDNDKLRMATTNFTKISDAAPREVELFSDVKIADKKLQGTCIMFNQLHFYKCCKKHMAKLDDEGNCPHCGQIDEQGKSADFRCSLVIDNPEDVDETEIVIFKRHLNLNIDADTQEDMLIAALEDTVMGKNCEIHYNEISDGNNIAVKITLA